MGGNGDNDGKWEATATKSAEATLRRRHVRGDDEWEATMSGRLRQVGGDGKWEATMTATESGRQR